MARRKKKPRHKGGLDFSFTIDAMCIALRLPAAAFQNPKFEGLLYPSFRIPHSALRTPHFRGLPITPSPCRPIPLSNTQDSAIRYQLSAMITQRSPFPPNSVKRSKYALALKTGCLHFLLLQNICRIYLTSILNRHIIYAYERGDNNACYFKHSRCPD